MIRHWNVKTLRSWMLGFAVFATWFVPSPGIMGLRTSLGLIVVILVAGRLPRRVKSHVFFLIAAGLVAVSPAELPIRVKHMAQILAVTSFLPPVAVIQGVIWLLMSLIIVIKTAWAWVLVLVAAFVAIRKNDYPPPVSLLRLGVLCSLVASIISIVLTTYPMVPIHGSEHDARWHIAGILNRRNPMVRLKSVYEALRETGHSHRGMDYVRILDDVEGKVGSTPDILTLRIAALDIMGKSDEARAHLVESVRSHPTIPARVVDWFPDCAPWIRAASYLHTGNPNSRKALLGFKADDFKDSISAEYAARTLLACGLSDEACSLCIAAGYKDNGWSRYVLWRSHMPWDTSLIKRMISDTLVFAPIDSFILLRGEPARGKWPEYHMQCGDVQVTRCVRSEFPVAVSLYGSSCTLRFLNDLRSYKDDRNLIYSGMIAVDNAYPDSLDIVVEVLWSGIMTRVEKWNLSVTDSFDIHDLGITGTMERIRFSDASGIVPDTVGFMMTSQGYLQWRDIPAGEYAAIMRAEPAQGRWPVIEWWEGMSVRHDIVDSWSWRHIRISHETGDSILTLKFRDDYWDEETNEDRNVWFAGLVRM